MVWSFLIWSFLRRIFGFTKNLKKVFPGIFLILLFHGNVAAQISSKNDSLIRAAKSQSPSAEKIKTFQLLGVEYAKKHPDSALKYFHRAISIGQEIQEKRYTTSTYSQLALLHNRMGNSDSSRFYLQKTHLMAERYPSEIDISNYYQTTGLLYKSTGEYNQAIEIFKKQINLLESETADKIQIAGAYHNLASVYWLLKK